MKLKPDNSSILLQGRASTNPSRLVRLRAKIEKIRQSLSNVEVTSTAFKLRKRAFDYFRCHDANQGKRGLNKAQLLSQAEELSYKDDPELLIITNQIPLRNQ